MIPGLRRYLTWLARPASTWPARTALAVFAGLNGLPVLGAGLVGGVVLGGYPGHARATGAGLAVWGAVCVVLAYRILRGRALNLDLVAIAVWWLPERWLDAWANDLPRRWHWPVVPLAMLVWLLAHAVREVRRETAARPLMP